MIAKSKSMFIDKFVKPSAQNFWVRILCGLFFLFLLGVGSYFSILLQKIFPPNAQYSRSNMHFNNQWIRSDLFAAGGSIDSVFIARNDINQVNAWYQNEGWSVCDLEDPLYCFRSKDHSLLLGSMMVEPILSIQLKPMLQSPVNTTEVTTNLGLVIWWHK